MPRRQDVIARSVTRAIVHNDGPCTSSTFDRFTAFFKLYEMDFECIRADLFKELRNDVWQLKEKDYTASFGGEGKDGNSKLQAMEDMGFSGSTFFTTEDTAYIVKSVPRHFEHSFFKNDFLIPYVEHVHNNPGSLLIRTTEFLANKHFTIGQILQLAPTHHIAMENLLYQQGKNHWETYDLKPMSYFYPERDIAGGALTSEQTKSKLADKFKDKLSLTLDQAEALKYQLEKDTSLLATCNAVDYSLFLVRIPVTEAPNPFDDPQLNATPLVPPGPPSFRTGMPSTDGKWVYRAAVLDFFWAKHKAHAKAMSLLINAYNIFDRKGPMSVTTNSPEYRQRFLKMIYDMIEVRDDTTEQNG
ncbi:SAICAR synthase-like protein [Zymoseptoria brevis]|uniref:SAICAR synthase-like protein n=1 Tax=Zymoseptoria brevis TaxID=1047168 RepID=A0A0F4GEH2_9PEZI|nr:SAICAR synthase-like protein [Zymoseptoria brevis]